VLDALRMHTNWCAKLSFDENERGSLTEGKVADFFVLNQNPLQTPKEKLKQLKIESVYLKGDMYPGHDSRSALRFFIDSIQNKYPV
jgi:hypothetical protein